MLCHVLIAIRMCNTGNARFWSQVCGSRQGIGSYPAPTLIINLADRAWGRSRLRFRLPPLELFSETDNRLKRTGKFPYQNNIGNLPFSWHPCPACCCYFLIQHPTTSLIAGISPWLFLASKAARSPSLGPVRCAGSGI